MGGGAKRTLAKWSEEDESKVFARLIPRTTRAKVVTGVEKNPSDDTAGSLLIDLAEFQAFREARKPSPKTMDHLQIGNNEEDNASSS